MKLTNDQIEALRQFGDWAEQLAEKLAAGESVTVVREVKRWEPDWRLLHGPASELKECRATMRLLAYREEFAPGYVVPDSEKRASFVGWYAPYKRYEECGHTHTRAAGVVYMPRNVAEGLCRKLNSGEVVL
jgi:hypothetical protein